VKHWKAFLLISIISPLSVSAGFKAGITELSQYQSDPGDEIDVQTLSAEYSQVITAISAPTSIYTAGVSWESTTVRFDEPLIGDEHLMKAQLPVTGTLVKSAETLFNWILAPGWHGEHGKFSDADFRLTGQGMFILPRPGKQWLLGLAYGEQFGKPQLVPLLGVAWQLSENEVLQTMFPMIKYERTALDKKKYNATLQPVGAQWSWAPGTVAGNTEAGNLELSGVQLSGGAVIPLEKMNVQFSLGLVTARKIKITRQSDPSVNGTVKLKNAWTANLGVEFP